MVLHEPHVGERRREPAVVRLPELDFSGRERHRLARGVAERLAVHRVEAADVDNWHVDAGQLSAGATPVGFQIARIAARWVKVRVLIEYERRAALPFGTSC